jgi:hydroxymethylpyrimidine pyrophosphatase-like HAD family hydrolase
MGVFTKTRISSVPEKLYLYRKHGNQLSRNRAGKEDFERISQTIKEFHQHYGINYPGSDIFYFARPRNIFSDKLQKLEREKLVQYLYEVQNALFQIFHQPKIRMEITKLIDIRIQSLSPVRGASRLAINQIESLLKRPNYGI